ncbi:MAG: hypothetical protein WC756_03610 [Taibaiella sp.]|jgi:hypothetical protein
MCDCIENLKVKMLAAFKEKNPTHSKGLSTEDVDVDNEALFFNDAGVSSLQLTSGISIKYMRGKQNNYFKPKVKFTYCPLCGVKY